MSVLMPVLIVVLTVLAMEGIAYSVHRWVMHGPLGWGWHKSHHEETHGPFEKNDKSWRGLYIFNVATVEEAQKLVVLDPAVKAGVFVPDLTLWYGSAAMMVVSDTHKRVVKPQK